MPGKRTFWVKHVFKDFEYNPVTQIQFHFVAMIFWMLNLVAGTFVLIFFPTEWVSIGVFYVFALSIYANWATDYGAVSAAQASLHGEYLIKQQGEAPVEVTVDQITYYSEDDPDSLL